VADCEVADRFISGPDPPDLDNQFEIDADAALSGLSIRQTGPDTLDYFVTQQAHDVIAQGVRRRSSHLWDLDPQWDLGGMTVEDSRTFWITVQALCELNTLICGRSGLRGGALGSVILIRSFRNWVEEIGRLSGLPAGKVDLLIRDHTYDQGLFKPKEEGA
jgi:hypothetical protein